MVPQRTSHRLAGAGYRLELDDVLTWVCLQCGEMVLGDEQRATLSHIAQLLETYVQNLRATRYV